MTSLEDVRGFTTGLFDSSVVGAGRVFKAKYSRMVGQSGQLFEESSSKSQIFSTVMP